MKTMTCKQLGGACEIEFQAETFEQMAKKSQKHGKEMMEKGDGAHIKVMEKMKDKSENKMNEWMQKKKEEFNALPKD